MWSCLRQRLWPTPCWAPALALGLAGLAHAASLAWPLETAWPVRGAPLWALQVLALSALVALLRAAPNARAAAWRAQGFATVWLAATWAWLYVSMQRYGGLPVPLAGAAVLLLAAALAIFSAAAGGLFWALSQVGRAWIAPTFVACWGLAELARGQVLTGFGWGAGGYAHADGPLALALPWVGQYGVTMLAAGWAAALAQGGRVRAAAALLLALGLAGGAVWAPRPDPTTAQRAPVSVDVLQGNVEQEEKFQRSSGVPHALRWYGQALLASRADLVVTPETAWPVLPDELPTGYVGALREQLAGKRTAALIGQPLGDFEQGYTNSVRGLAPGQPEWRYAKHHLVPFGEFIPPLARWFTDLMAIPLGDFSRGPLPQPPLVWAGERWGVSVCFENLFSEELAAAFADPAHAPTVLVNVSNLGWFGAHLAMDQHLQIARVRALEFNRPYVLATNTGRSAVVDAQGRITYAAPAHTASVLHAQVRGVDGLTPYARWAARWGQGPLLVLALTLLVLAALRRAQPLRPQRR